MSTITDVAARIRDAFDVTDDAALSTAQVYWSQIRRIDDDLEIAPDDVPVDQEVSDDDADFIVESTRAQLQAEGLL